MRDPPDQPGGWCGASPPDLADWLSGSDSLEVGGLGRGWSFSLRSGERLVFVRAGVATPGLVEVFGARPALGRGFERGDLQAGAPRAALLSHGFWRRHFGADPVVVGRTLELDGETHSVVGVLPEGFAVPDLTERDL